jgi:sporulation protein YlmC with PRC-barrel domain
MHMQRSTTGGTAIVGGRSNRSGPGPELMTAGTLTGDRVVNAEGDDLGKITEIMLDVPEGRIAYAVLEFGSVLGMGGKLFAVPWQSLTLDADSQCFILDIDQERLKSAPGFDKDNWPSMADEQWASSVHSFYGQQPYWQ